ncbi:gephyrin-like molybdotransferase Glp [Candidatus Clostridium radicumherbarum]|uniref:Molybdopterin molybdenumtransferase n=1 Tax=Candidatus Clostridium radicumherbarum TaxID=3381662 RepID=A0ABW8TW24_9CLOT
MELLSVRTTEEVRALINREFAYKLESETVSLLDSVNRICSKDIKANLDIPNFRRSTVDGFAVNSRDVFGASESMPAIMELIEEIIMGKSPESEIYNAGECSYVPTGGMLPQGSDSVVMLEYCDRLDDKTILINKQSAPGENVVQIGEDVSIGDIVVKDGQRLRPYEIGVLAAQGIKEVNIYKKPKVAIISTGDEIVSIETDPKLGEIRDINTYMLYSLIKQDGGIPISYGIVKDEFLLLRNIVDKALKECDIVLISGGSSVGKKDHTLKVIDSYDNGGVLVHGMAIKPGKPTIVGKAYEKIVFGLPGHPLAASVVYKILVKDYIDKLMKLKEEEYGIAAEMSINYHKAMGREEYLPVSLRKENDKVIAYPVFGKSGIITAFSRAYGYIRINKDVEGLYKGEKIEVYKL